MKLERIGNIAEALDILVEEIKESEVTGLQLTYIGKLDEKFANNLKYLTELIIVPDEVTPTTDEETSTNEKAYSHNDRHLFLNRRVTVTPVDGEYTIHPKHNNIRLSKNGNCQILMNGAWVPVAPTVEKGPAKTERLILTVDGTRYMVSRLMLETFVGLPCPEEFYIKSFDYFSPHFKDGNKLNCDIDNLQWGIIRNHTVKPLVSHNSDTGFVVHPRYPEIRVNKNGECQRLICGVWTDAAIYKQKKPNNNVVSTVNVSPGSSKLVSLEKLILETFKGVPNTTLDISRLCVRHKDGDSSNFNVENLEWCNRNGIPFEPCETETNISKADRANTLKLTKDILNGGKNVIDIFAQTKDITLAETLLKKKAENNVPFTQDDRFVAVLTCTSGTSNGNRIMQKLNKKYGKQYVTKQLLNQVRTKSYRKELCDLVF